MKLGAGQTNASAPAAQSSIMLPRKAIIAIAAIPFKAKVAFAEFAPDSRMISCIVDLAAVWMAYLPL